MGKKEFLIKKISDQKDGFKEGYSYYRDLEINEEGIPVEEELNELLNLEQNKNVTFFIGENNISIISFVNDFKYTRNTLKEFKNNWCSGNLKSVKVRTFYKHFEYLKDIIPDLQMVQRESVKEDYKSR